MNVHLQLLDNSCPSSSRLPLRLPGVSFGYSVAGFPCSCFIGAWGIFLHQDKKPNVAAFLRLIVPSLRLRQPKRTAKTN